jgi:hypothetical protein
MIPFLLLAASYRRQEMTLFNWVQMITSVIQAVGSLSIVVVFWMYKNQRKAALESERQANRARLTEAYMTYHRAIVSDKDNIRIYARMIRRGYDVFDPQSSEFEDATRAIELLYLRLNAFFLEWSYRNAYSLDSNNDQNEFLRTFDHAMKGLVTNDDPQSRLIVANFEHLFEDFPRKFMTLICSRLRDLKKRLASGAPEP